MSSAPSLLTFSLSPSPAPTEYVTYQYANPSAHSQGHMHVVAPTTRVETGQRKRPKYTRSKTGCLTCRGKKIKVRSLFSLSTAMISSTSASVTSRSPVVYDAPMASERYATQGPNITFVINHFFTSAHGPKACPHGNAQRREKPVNPSTSRGHQPLARQSYLSILLLQPVTRRRKERRLNSRCLPNLLAGPRTYWRHSNDYPPLTSTQRAGATPSIVER